MRAVNLGPLSQATDLTLIQGLYKLDAAARENRRTFTHNYLFIPVLGIRNQIRIRMFLGLPDPDPLVREVRIRIRLRIRIRPRILPFLINVLSGLK